MHEATLTVLCGGERRRWRSSATGWRSATGLGAVPPRRPPFRSQRDLAARRSAAPAALGRDQEARPRPAQGPTARAASCSTGCGCSTSRGARPRRTRATRPAPSTSCGAAMAARAGRARRRGESLGQHRRVRGGGARAWPARRGLRARHADRPARGIPALGAARRHRHVLRHVQALARVSADVRHLLAALPPLAPSSATATSARRPPRPSSPSSTASSSASSSACPEPAPRSTTRPRDQRRDQLRAVHAAVSLLEGPERSAGVAEALGLLVHRDAVHGLVRGRAAAAPGPRELGAEELGTRSRRALSAAVPPSRGRGLDRGPLSRERAPAAAPARPVGGARWLARRASRARPSSRAAPAAPRLLRLHPARAARDGREGEEALHRPAAGRARGGRGGPRAARAARCCRCWRMLLGVSESMTQGEDERLRRWRLVLGEPAQPRWACRSAEAELRMDQALAALYDRERKAGLGASSPNVARWLGDIRTYFPASVVRVMQQDALERLGLRQMLLRAGAAGGGGARRAPGGHPALAAPGDPGRRRRRRRARSCARWWTSWSGGCAQPDGAGGARQPQPRHAHAPAARRARSTGTAPSAPT